MSWTETFSGRRFVFDAPTVEMIDPLDIAHALSMKCRYNGHCHTFYSVAEHSCLVSEAIEDRLGGADDQLWGLLHDAAEAYVPDMPRPIKEKLPGFAEAEERIMRVIAERFGLRWPEPAIVKEMDTRILGDEAQWLMHSQGAGWNLPLPPLKIRPAGWLPLTARACWIGRFEQLTGEKVSGQGVAFEARKRACAA
jgi:hypothetical protein